MKHLFILFLLGTFPFFAYGQTKELNLEATKPGTQLPIEDAKSIEEIKTVEDTKLIGTVIKQRDAALPFSVMKVERVKEEERKAPESQSEFMRAQSPEEKKAVMIKQVLGEVYTEVGHIPEPQWFEMEPIAEVYVNALFKARTMADDEAATQLAANAKAEFDAAINAKLTTEQKAKMQQQKDYITSEYVRISQLMMPSYEYLQGLQSRGEIGSESQTIIIDYK